MVVNVAERSQVEQAPVLYGRAVLDPSTWNEADGTVEAVLSTGARGRRRDCYSGEEFDEELEISASAIRMDRLNAGCSVLDSHSGWSIGNVLGRVVPGTARIEDIELKARLQISRAPEHAGLRANVKAGIVTHISVGYRTYKLIIDETVSPPLHRAVDWEVFEVSFVSIPFDAGANTRSGAGQQGAGQQTNECTVIHRHEEGSMKPITTTTDGNGQGENRGAQPVMPTATATPLENRGGTPTPTNTHASVTETRAASATQPTALDIEGARREGMQLEAQRQTHIRSLATRLGVEEAVVAPLLGDSTRSIDYARSVFLEHVAVRSQANPTRVMGSPIQIVGEERDKVRLAAVAALQHRGNPGRYPITSDADKLGARDFAGMSLIRMGEELARRQDASFRWSGRDELMQRMFLSTSDFPYIAQQAVRRSLRDQYDEAEATWKPWVRTATMQDFRTTNRTQLSGAQALLEVPENGEIEGSELGETNEGYKLSTFARKVSINRQTIINDDLDAFSRVPMLLGNAARRLESDKVYAVLNANANMADATALFHASHANLITPALNLAALTTMRVAMRKQTGQVGEILNLVPKFLIVPVGLETTGWQLMNGEFMAVSAPTTNMFKGSMTLIVEPRLDVSSATVWYAACAPGQCDTVEIGFLEGSSGPVVEQHNHFDVLGMSLRVYHDVGVKAIDWRGMIKSSATT